MPRPCLILFCILLSAFSASAHAQEVEIVSFNRFADHEAAIPGAFKICRHLATPDGLAVDYAVSGAGAAFVELDDGTLEIPAYAQCAEQSFATRTQTSETLPLEVRIVPSARYAIHEPRAQVSFRITHQTPTPAFVGAEGAARYIGSEVAESTWRGQPVFFVENLNRAGEGSLTAAWNAASRAGGGYIIPRVSGIIDASETRLAFRDSRGVYFAGQAAPGPLLIVGADNGCFSISGSRDVLVRYLSVLHMPPTTSGSLDAIEVFNATDVYLNHIDAGRGVDEAVSATVTDYRQQSGRITMDWNLFMEMDPDHTTGSLTGGLGSGNDDPEARQFRGVRAQIPVLAYSYNKNLTIDISHRFPNASGYGHWEVVNNVLANHRNRWMQISYPQPRVGLRNNFIRPGPVTRRRFGSEENGFRFAGNRVSRTSWTFDDQQMGLIRIEGTIVDGFFEDANADNWLFNTYFFDREFLDQPVARSQELETHPLVYGETQVLSARDAYEAVTAERGAGNSARLRASGAWEADRIAYMQTLVNRVLNDEMSEQYPARDSWERPDVESRSPYEDVDRDGMADEWERAQGLEVGLDDHAGRDLDPRRDNLEVFLDGPQAAVPCCEDSGVSADSGTPNDGGSPRDGSTAEPEDASPTADAGDDTSGGGCQSATPSAYAALALLGLCFARRRFGVWE